MNVALTLGQDNKAMLVYDQPLGFVPAWIESSADGRGIRIIGEEGQEFVAGLPQNKIISKIAYLKDVLLVRMENRRAAEQISVPFINQNYGEN